MLIDKKREEMYYNCRMRKKAIDTKMAVIRALLFIPPALILIGAIGDIAMAVLTDTTILMTGAGLYGYEVTGTSPMYLLDIISSGTLITISLCISFFRTDNIIRKSPYIYLILTILFLVLMFLSDYPLMLVCTALSATGIPLSVWNKKLIAEDNKMSTLEGYPHFNPLFMKNTDTPFVPATNEEIDGMSADERIMYEREH